MPTQAQLAANRRPSPKDQRSTGPRTPAGKARSSQNALKHGLRAQAVLDVQFTILGENPADFANLLQSLADDLKPVGALEEISVESIALCLWRHRRLLLSEMGYIADRQYRFCHGSYGGPVDQARASIPLLDDLDLLTRYEAHLNRQLQWHLARFAQLQRERRREAKASSEGDTQRRREDAAFASAISRATSVIEASRALARRTGAIPPVHDVHPAPAVPSTPVLPTEPNSPARCLPAPNSPSEPNSPAAPSPAPGPRRSVAVASSFPFVPSATTIPPNESSIKPASLQAVKTCASIAGQCPREAS